MAGVLRAMGMVSRRERWGLTWRGWLLLAAVAAVSAGLVMSRVHDFLAVTSVVESPVVVVEGWVPPAILRDVASRYVGKPGMVLYCTGGPSDEAFDSSLAEDTCAAEAARILRGYGIPDERLVVVPTFESQRDRTYASAVALRDWFRDQKRVVPALNVVTEGPHSRRSRLMFEEAFGPQVAVGIVAIPDPDYESARWWKYSEGVKAVISEAAAYVYARLLFEPVDDSAVGGAVVTAD